MPANPFSRGCRMAGCAHPAAARGYCQAHATTVDRARGLDSDRHHKALYASPRWRALRQHLLTRHPVCRCEECAQLGRVRATAVVHHKAPHGGDEAKFFDERNLEPLAKLCHDRITGKSLRRKGIGGQNSGGASFHGPRLRVARETLGFRRGVLRGHG